MNSSDLFYVDVVGERESLRNLDRLPVTVRVILREKVRVFGERMRDLAEENIKTRFKSGGPSLIEGLNLELIEGPNLIESRLSIVGVPWARIQEKGGTIGPHMIYPRQAKVLAFYGVTGDKVFASRVFHPGASITPKWFMRDARRQVGSEISKGIKAAIVQGIREQMRMGR